MCAPAGVHEPAGGVAGAERIAAAVPAAAARTRRAVHRRRPSLHQVLQRRTVRAQLQPVGQALQVRVQLVDSVMLCFILSIITLRETAQRRHVFYRAVFDASRSQLKPLLGSRWSRDLGVTFARLLKLPLTRIKEYCKLLGKLALRFPSVSLRRVCVTSSNYLSHCPF